MSDDTKSGIAHMYAVTAEDANGVYFGISMLAVNADDAEKRARAVLVESVRIIGISA